MLVDTIRGQSYNFKNTLFVDTVYVVEVKTWSGMKYAKSFPLKMMKGREAGIIKAIGKKKNHRNFSFLCQYFNCSVNRTIETNWQNIKNCLAEWEVVSVKLCNFLNFKLFNGKKEDIKNTF